MLKVLGPGLLVAATGVGAGDLLNTALAGSEVGPSLIWAAILGALLKWTLNEGIARWQLGSGSTLLEGWNRRLGAWTLWIFLVYFLVWSLMVGSALISACGVAGDALLPLGTRAVSRPLWGIVHSIVGLLLVVRGGFRLFEKVMSCCIAVMFVGVIITAILLRPDLSLVARSLMEPRLDRSSVFLAMGVLGGVGGTVTLLSYGYWIGELGREGRAGLRACRIDLTVAYAGTAIFAVAMLVISSRVRIEGSGADVALRLADELAIVLGSPGRWLFLVGFWAAVFSSLLGVWQSAPYLFADILAVRRASPEEKPPPDLRQTRSYKAYLFAMAFVPIPFLSLSVRQIQLAYAVMGSLFMPLLAFTLLIMNNQTGWVGPAYRSGLLINLLLVVTLVIFALLGMFGIPAS